MLARYQHFASFRAQQLVAPDLLHHVRIALIQQIDAVLQALTRNAERVILLLLGGKLGLTRGQRHQPTLTPDGEVPEIGDRGSANGGEDQNPHNSRHTPPHHHGFTESHAELAGKRKLTYRAISARSTERPAYTA